jgi:phosphoribosylformylglycinamidine synthase
VETVTVSTASPWLKALQPGDRHQVPVSHGEGRFDAPPELLQSLAENGQIAFQYCGSEGEPAMDYPANPNGSALAVEGLISPGGRILGKMGHSERIGRGIAKNIPGEKDQHLFESAVRFFSP